MWIAPRLLNLRIGLPSCRSYTHNCTPSLQTCFIGIMATGSCHHGIQLQACLSLTVNTCRFQDFAERFCTHPNHNPHSLDKFAKVHATSPISCVFTATSYYEAYVSMACMMDRRSSTTMRSTWKSCMSCCRPLSGRMPTLACAYTRTHLRSRSTPVSRMPPWHGGAPAYWSGWSQQACAAAPP